MKTETNIKKQNDKENLRDFLSTCLRIADTLEDMEDEDANEVSHMVGLGYLALLNIMRRGVVLVINMQNSLTRCEESLKLEKLKIEELQKALRDLTGVSEFNTLPDEIYNEITKMAENAGLKSRLHALECSYPDKPDFQS